MIKRLISTFAALATLASAGTLFLPAYPNALLVFDESKGEVVDRIPLTTGTPRAMRLSQDRKTIYVTTIDHNGIEVVDVATRKVINHFVLNTSTKQFRMRGGAPDPNGKLFYTVTKEIDKLPDHYEVHDEVHRNRSVRSEDRQDRGHPSRGCGCQRSRFRTYTL